MSTTIDNDMPTSNRNARIMRAYNDALAGRDPNAVGIEELLAAIFAAVPDASDDNIADALEEAECVEREHADELRHYAALKSRWF
jgi:hypothetical protein